jgi:flagellar biosynthetic protein FliP
MNVKMNSILRPLSTGVVMALCCPFVLYAQGGTDGYVSASTGASASASAFSAANGDFLPAQHQLRLIGFLALLSLIPFGVLMMTSFTRISIIFQFLKQALGSTQIPSNQIIIGLSLILTGFIMHPVINEIQEKALVPYFNGSFKQYPAVLSHSRTEEGALLEAAWDPLRRFLLSHTREKDLELFLEIGQIHLQKIQTASGSEYDMNGIPWYCLIPSFVMSELRIAFMMGFLLFLPFLIIDMVVSSVLMSMGMIMLPPILISTPFKLLLFILIDGWRLIIQQVVNGYHPTG